MFTDMYFATKAYVDFYYSFKSFYYSFSRIPLNDSI